MNQSLEGWKMFVFYSFYSRSFVMHNYSINARMHHRKLRLRWSFDSLKHIRIINFYPLASKQISLRLGLTSFAFTIVFADRYFLKSWHGTEISKTTGSDKGSLVAQVWLIAVHRLIFISGKLLTFLEGNTFENSTNF